MTALKTGNAPAVAVRCAARRDRRVRALDMHRYKKQLDSTLRPKRARWETRYQIGAMVYALALGTWCMVACWSATMPSRT